MKKVLQVIEQLRGYMGEEGKKAEEEEEKRKNERGGREGTGGNINSQSNSSLISNGQKGKGEQIGGERIWGGGREGGEDKGQEEVGEGSGITENDDKERVLKCLAEGMFLRSARLNNDGRTYTLQVDNKIRLEIICYFIYYIYRLYINR